MNDRMIPAAVCAVVAEVISPGRSHAALEALFRAAGAPGEPPDLAHQTKWKTWLRQAGEDPAVDALQVLGRIIEEFMDLPPADGPLVQGFWGTGLSERTRWEQSRARLSAVLEEHGLRYFRGGRVLPNGVPEEPAVGLPSSGGPRRPTDVEQLLSVIVRNLPNAMAPLQHRRKGLTALSFSSEYDVQDLLHAMLRPWIKDIRGEEPTPSLAGSSTRMDFLLPAHRMVIETKIVRDRRHALKMGEELLLDIEHYRQHPHCAFLWCVVYDPNHLLPNPGGFATDLEGKRSAPGGSVEVKVIVVPAR